MTRLALALALCAAPAAAEVVDLGSWQRPSRMTLLPGEPPCFAVVSIENRAGVYNRTETLDTEAGPVSIRYQTVGGHNPTDHDIVEVVDLPENVAANPLYIALPDGETGQICLMRMVGV